ncbi:MurR/RpiR family transcriptional regulator (plasmid) [Rhizobium oryzihabitans]|uniref:MurR/RpiR family transcriptional regulator n=1 Tax=Rhizobium oryzihabitans TaxID=2267833 RepID=A0A7L5BRQ9_9HYPH|nr:MULTISPECIES: MurR/RpiR family transcriptional regulator [Rhizobium/Agrobacterium group]QIB41463.1 MurR/RpiR family transcriptional regulator [Rhizobium oryzihabitans]RSC24860.1 MurR/RpiR family transcriptional regulator [Agrobacterium sp. FDAARGOS_525]
MSVLKVIQAKLDSMTDAERQIGQFIIEDPDRMVQLSSAELAGATGRSQSSVVKFSQKIGYEGYQQLKLAVTKAKAQEWRVPSGMIHGTIEAGDNYVTIQQKLVASKVSAMQQTMQVNSEEAVKRAVAALVRARRIHLAGIGASSLVARDFSYKLLKLGLMVLMDRDPHVQMANAASLRESDVLFAISQAGSNNETIRLAELARKCGAKVITLTGLQGSRLGRLADISLYTVADEERVRSSAITSRDAQLAICDLLFLLLIAKLPGANEAIHASEAAVSILKS